jgi:hypothetical protein
VVRTGAERSRSPPHSPPVCPQSPRFPSPHEVTGSSAGFSIRYSTGDSSGHSIRLSVGCRFIVVAGGLEKNELASTNSASEVKSDVL